MNNIEHPGGFACPEWYASFVIEKEQAEQVIDLASVRELWVWNCKVGNFKRLAGYYMPNRELVQHTGWSPALVADAGLRSIPDIQKFVLSHLNSDYADMNSLFRWFTGCCPTSSLSIFRVGLDGMPELGNRNNLPMIR